MLLQSVALSMRWTKRKKKEFRLRIKLVEEYQNKVFYYTQRIKEDGIITINELNKQFDELLAKFDNKLLEIKFTQTKIDYNNVRKYFLIVEKGYEIIFSLKNGQAKNVPQNTYSQTKKILS